MSKRGKSVLYVLAAGVLWGIISLFIRQLSAAGLSEQQIVAIRLILSTLMFFPYLALRDRRLLRIRLRDLPVFLGTGIVSVCLFFYLYFYTTVRSQASVAVVLLYTAPAFVILLSALCFRERITGRKCIALVMTFLGCVFVSGLPGSGTPLTPLVLLTGIGSGLFYALYTIFARLALRRCEPLTVTAYTFLVGAVGSLSFGNVPAAVSAVAAKPALLLPCLGIALVCTVLPYVLYTSALRDLDSGTASILATSEPLVGALLGILAYGDPCGLFRLLGMLLILGAVPVVNSVRQENKPADPQEQP